MSSTEASSPSVETSPNVAPPRFHRQYTITATTRRFYTYKIRASMKQDIFATVGFSLSFFKDEE